MPREDEGMYVGYLPVPVWQKRFLRWCVPLTLWMMCLASVIFAWSQRSPGTAIWASTPVTVSGKLVLRPYPMLLVDEPASEAGAVLLVEMGKHGTQARFASMGPARVSATGFALMRDGRRMLELDAPESAVRVIEDLAVSDISAAMVKTAGGASRVKLFGEIVDAKCYLGAMKPGEGKTHKECATLCIRGGIPPMLVYVDDSGRRRYALVADAAGGPAGPEIWPLIGDLVEVEGELGAIGDVDASPGGDEEAARTIAVLRLTGIRRR